MRVGLSMRQERPLFLQSLTKWYAAETDEKGPFGRSRVTHPHEAMGGPRPPVAGTAAGRAIAPC